MPFSFSELQQRVIDLPYENTNFASDEVVRLNKVSIRYDDRTILKELDWTVLRGQKWALSGENERATHFAQSGMRGQSSILCLRHQSVRP